MVPNQYDGPSLLDYKTIIDISQSTNEWKRQGLLFLQSHFNRLDPSL
jgi:hypothetical protein